MEYSKPTISELGSFGELTLATITKDGGSGDTIVYNGTSIPVPGGGIVGIS